MTTWDDSLGAAAAAIQTCKGHMAQVLLVASQSREKADEILSLAGGGGNRSRQWKLRIVRSDLADMERNMVENFETAEKLLRAIQFLRNEDGND